MRPIQTKTKRVEPIFDILFTSDSTKLRMVGTTQAECEQIFAYFMQDAVNAGYVPMRDGEGFRAITGSGTEVSLIRFNKGVGSEQHGLLNDDQEVAFERAKQISEPAFGSRWVEARKVLEEAGFKVFKL